MRVPINDFLSTQYEVDNALACTVGDTNEEEFIFMSGLAVLAGGIFLLQGLLVRILLLPTDVQVDFDPYFC